MTELELTGCPFQPLTAYLKALAVLRLISEQADTSARGHWTNRYFVLESELDREALIDFFLTRYKPTPVLAPWNGGSGFYPKDRKIGIGAIQKSKEERFGDYRRDLEAVASIVKKTGVDKGASKAEEDQRRTDILRECRNTLSDQCVSWLDAAIAIAADESRSFAPILGTGGNEGRLDYTNNFMENIAKLLISPDKKMPVRALLENALFDTQSGGLQDLAVGQYDPGRAGGFNQGNGIEAKSVANPWNAVLTVEGAAAWAGGIYRKQGISYRSFLCSPFTVRPSAVGYGSVADKDETTARAEIWTPLWDKAARYGEIRSLLREGRAAVNGGVARSGLEFAQAAASLGVDRAIPAFMRYSLVKRRGDSYIALPTGRFRVEYRSTADRIRELTPFVERANYEAKGGQSETPNSWPPLKRAVEEAIFKTLLRGDAQSLVDVASAFGAMHRWLLLRGRVVPWKGKLNAGWIQQCAICPEGRVAGALAGLWSTEAGGLLENTTAGKTRFSWIGRDLPSRLLMTLRRRTLDGQSLKQSPFRSARCAWPSDVAAFLDGSLDDELIESLMFAFVLIGGGEIRNPAHEDPEQCLRWPAYCLLKQLFAAEEIETPKGRVLLRPDPRIPALLAAGRSDEATDVALRRLRVSGLIPTVREGERRNSGDTLRLGAALLIPVWGLERLRASVVERTRFDLVES